MAGSAMKSRSGWADEHAATRTLGFTDFGEVTYDKREASARRQSLLCPMAQREYTETRIFVEVQTSQRHWKAMLIARSKRHLNQFVLESLK